MDTTPSSEASATILKTDVLGRVKTPRARREELLDQFERSGLSGQKFAELAGVKYQTLLEKGSVLSIVLFRGRRLIEPTLVSLAALFDPSFLAKIGVTSQHSTFTA